MIKFTASLIWNLSERKIIPPLGRFAPYIFGLSIGSKKMTKTEKHKKQT